MRVELLKKAMEADGHSCVVLNIGRSRTIPSPEYETVRSGRDYVAKVWRFSRAGYVAHVHVNGESPKGFVLALLAQFINLVSGKRSFLTFHAGVDQLYFPLPKYRWLWPMYWTMFAIPKRIVCNSDAVKAKIREYGVPASKIVPIPAFSTQYLAHDGGDLPEALDRFYRAHSSVLFTYIRVRPGFFLDTLIEGFARLLRTHQDIGLVICGVSGDIDAALMADMEARISHHQLADRVHIVDDLEHDAFLTALTQSAAYVRTPVTDGVASSVLEALSLGVPVVGSENGTRPPGVITYRADDPESLAGAITKLLAHRQEIVASLPRPPVRDTLSEEMHLLTGTA
jgi:glycosyltransferase involved in cell wall biosynthesis